MAGINGSIQFSLQPLNTDNASGQAGAFWDFRNNYLKSANDQLRYQIQWTNSGLTEVVEPSKNNFANNDGDIVYIEFKVQVTCAIEDGFDTIASITKTRDVPNSRYNTGDVAPNHRFTIDVSHIVSDELSYSLCPINKGTWQSATYGGMNGGKIMPDNVIANTGTMGSPVSDYNVSKNGTFRMLRVRAIPYIINASGELVVADGGITSKTIAVINSVNQIEEDRIYYNSLFTISSSTTTATQQKHKFLTRCFNFSTSATKPQLKPVRIDEEAEFLQFYVNQAKIGGSTTGAMGLKVETFTTSGAENTFYLRDFEGTAKTELDAATSKYHLKDTQNLTFIQNISPYYINNTAALKTPSNAGATSFPYWTSYSGNKITDSTTYYRVSLSKFLFGGAYTETRYSEYRMFSIDREDTKIPYEFVRFHWLNDMGGIDSYTAKRDIMEQLSVEKDIIERNVTDRTWYQSRLNQGSTLADGIYHSDTMRGGDIYKGGREVTKVSADKTQSVYTEPLNTEAANWLKKIFLSPNVWIEKDTEATQMGNTRNQYLRPSDKEYIPIIITNSNITTLDQKKGLVEFNIEYTLSHKVITQRN